MKTNKKGLEGIPFRLVISLLVIGAIVYATFEEISVFTRLNQKQRSVESVKNLLSTMNSLSSVDEGFSNVQVYVMQNSTLVFDNETERITLKNSNQTVFDSGHDIAYAMNLTNGVWEVRVHHGTLPYQEFLQKKPILVFK